VLGKWLLVVGGILVLTIAVMVVLGQRREAAEEERLRVALLGSVSAFPADTVRFDSLSDLPPPVERYLRHVLTEGQPLIRAATLDQSGVVRTDIESETWSPFSARHLAVSPVSGFLWNARVGMPLGLHVRVMDSYSAGIGSGRVSLMSALVVAAEAGGPELNSGALHRYLAEAVWYPTALLPESGIEWSPVDGRTAIATLTDQGTTVSLEFRFNDLGEVTGIYSGGRWGRFGGGYEQVPWEGRFRDYQVRDGMRVPAYGEVGWYDEEGELQLVWKGDIVGAAYEFGR